jgi:hypothetical protein
MRSFVLVLFLACAGVLSGQSFDCYASGPLPANPAFSCEGAVWNGLGAAAVTATASCAFPTSGSKYLSVSGTGPIAVPLGGPLPRPFAGGANEVRMPIPYGAAAIVLGWDFFSAECPSDAVNNDGISIDVVDATGAFVASIAYADTSSIEAGACALAGLDRCGGPIGDVGPIGPNTAFVPLPALPPCSYISIVVWDGGDTLNPSTAFLDSLTFDVYGPWCDAPCFAPAAPGAPTLSFDSGGTGCVVGWITGMPPGGAYLLAITLNPGTFPTDWFYGIGIGVAELTGEINAGPPFTGSIGAAACNTGAAMIGPFCSLPPITIYAVALAGFTTPSISPPVTFTIL